MLCQCSMQSALTSIAFQLVSLLAEHQKQTAVNMQPAQAERGQTSGWRAACAAGTGATPKTK